MAETDFNCKLIHDNKVLPTLTAKGKHTGVLYSIHRYMNTIEWISASSFPKDYNFNNNVPEYIMGMSVPPLMAARIANEIYNQWLSKM